MVNAAKSLPVVSMILPPEYTYCPILFNAKLYFSIIPLPLSMVALKEVISSFPFLKNCSFTFSSEIPSNDVK